MRKKLKVLKQDQQYSWEYFKEPKLLKNQKQLQL